MNVRTDTSLDGGKASVKSAKSRSGRRCPSRAFMLSKGPPHGSHAAIQTGEASPGQAARVSREISAAAARGLLAAAAFAIEIGLPFNRFITIHWDAARVPDDQLATARYLRLTGDWVRSRGGKLAYIWVRENAGAKGRHVHILMHLPLALVADFNRLQRGWLIGCGAAWRKGVILTRPVGRGLDHALRGDADYQVNLADVVDYILKGTGEAGRAACVSIRRRADGGAIAGKRVGFSQNLGAAARKRWAENASAFGSAAPMVDARPPCSRRFWINIAGEGWSEATD